MDRAVAGLGGAPACICRSVLQLFPAGGGRSRNPLSEQNLDRYEKSSYSRTLPEAWRNPVKFIFWTIYTIVFPTITIQFRYRLNRPSMKYCRYENRYLQALAFFARSSGDQLDLRIFLRINAKDAVRCFGEGRSVHRVVIADRHCVRLSDKLFSKNWEIRKNTVSQQV